MTPMTVTHNHGFSAKIEDDFDGFDRTRSSLLTERDNDSLSESFLSYLEESVIATFEVDPSNIKLRDSIKSMLSKVDIDIEFIPSFEESAPGRADGTRKVNVTFPEGAVYTQHLAEYMNDNPYSEDDWKMNAVVFVDQTFNSEPSISDPIDLKVDGAIEEMKESYLNLKGNVSNEQLISLIADEAQELLGISDFAEAVKAEAGNGPFTKDVLESAVERKVFESVTMTQFPALQTPTMKQESSVPSNDVARLTI